MKNMAVLKRFATYTVYLSLLLLGFYTIGYQAEKMFGHAEYGFIGILGTMMLVFVYALSKSQVESEQRSEEHEQKMKKSKRFLAE